MQFIRRSALLLIFFAVFSGLTIPTVRAAGLDDDDFCESTLESLKHKIPSARARIIGRIEVPSSKWFAWERDGSRQLLASIDSSNVLRVFEPAKTLEPFYVSRWSTSDGQSKSFTHAEWVTATPGAPLIQAGDDRGNLVTFEPMTHPEPSARFQGSPVRVEPHSIELSDGQWVTAMSMANLQRVRIVPVGRWNAVHDLSTRGRIVAMAAHKTLLGDALLSVSTDSWLDIYKLGETQELISSTRLKGASIRPRWVTDESGESLLVTMDEDSHVHVVFPESHRQELKTEALSKEPGTLHILKQKDGVWVLAEARKPRSARLYKIQDKNIEVVRDLPQSIADSNDRKSLVAGPSDEPLLVSAKVVDGKKMIALTDANGTDGSEISVELDHASESVRRYEMLTLDANRRQLAVQTNQKIYIIEITARR